MTLLTVAQVAEHLQLSPKRIRELIRTGALRASKPGGGEYRITKAAVDELMAATEVQTGAFPDSTPGRPRRLSSAGRSTHFRDRATRRVDP